jgi:hypothetical protein
MKRIALIALTISLLSPAIARADDASKNAKILELFNVMHMDKTQGQIMEIALREVQLAAQQQLRGNAPTPDQQKKIEDFRQKATDIINGQIAWSKVEPDYIKLYNDAYSESELDGILAFYKSPAGQALLTKTPDLTAKSIAVSRDRMQTVQPQLRQILQDFIKDISTTPAPTTPAPATPAPPKGM